MSTTVDDFPDVRSRLRALDLGGGAPVLILPRGFTHASLAEELAHESCASTLAKLMIEAGLEVELAQSREGRLPKVQENAITCVIPAIFIAYSLASTNPAAVTVALNVLSNYVTDFFKGTLGGRRARLDIILEDSDGRCKRVHYDGPPEGLSEVRKAIGELRLGGGS